MRSEKFHSGIREVSVSQVTQEAADLEGSPVKEVVPGHHAQEACRVCHRVQLVVELLKLLVKKVSCLALRLAVGATPGARKTISTTVLAP